MILELRGPTGYSLMQHHVILPKAKENSAFNELPMRLFVGLRAHREQLAIIGGSIHIDNVLRRALRNLMESSKGNALMPSDKVDKPNFAAIFPETFQTRIDGMEFA